MKSVFPSITSQAQINTIHTRKERIPKFQVKVSLLLGKNSNVPLKYTMLESVYCSEVGIWKITITLIVVLQNSEAVMTF